MTPRKVYLLVEITQNVFEDENQDVISRERDKMGSSANGDWLVAHRLIRLW